MATLSRYPKGSPVKEKIDQTYPRAHTFHHRRSPRHAFPLHQRLYMRHYVGPILSKRPTIEATRKSFVVVHEHILSLLKSLPVSVLTRPVFLPPEPTLETNPIYWSPLMVAEHLVIVGEYVKCVIRGLAGVHPLPKAMDKVSFVPPENPDPAEVLKRFENYTYNTIDQIRPYVDKMDPKKTFVHPWFGPFNIQQWQWLLATHALKHSKQLNKVQEGLSMANIS